MPSHPPPCKERRCTHTACLTGRGGCPETLTIHRAESERRHCDGTSSAARTSAAASCRLDCSTPSPQVRYQHSYNNHRMFCMGSVRIMPGAVAYLLRAEARVVVVLLSAAEAAFGQLRAEGDPARQALAEIFAGQDRLSKSVSSTGGSGAGQILVPVVDTGFTGGPLRCCLFTPELQWQSRGQWRILQGLVRTRASQPPSWRACRTTSGEGAFSVCSPWIPSLFTPELQRQFRGKLAYLTGVRMGKRLGWVGSCLASCSCRWTGRALRRSGVWGWCGSASSTWRCCRT